MFQLNWKETAAKAQERANKIMEEQRVINETMRNYPGGSIQFIIDNLPEDTPSYNRNYFLKLKEKSDRYEAKNVKLNEEQERVRRELSSLLGDSFDFLVKNKNFIISKIEESYVLSKTQRFVLNGALSIFGKKTVIGYLPKFIKENETMANYLYDNYEAISKLVKSKDKEALWTLLGEDICNSLLEKKSDKVTIISKEQGVEVSLPKEAFTSTELKIGDKSIKTPIEAQQGETVKIPTEVAVAVNQAKKLEKEFEIKIMRLEKQEKLLQEEKNELEKKFQAIAALEEKYTTLLNELEEKSSKLAVEESNNPNKITGEAIMEYEPEIKASVEAEEKVENPKVDIIEGFSATESAVIKHMEEVLRHKKGTQNIWIDDETDKEHTFISTEKISRGGRVITDKKEILDYYKESRNIEKI